MRGVCSVAYNFTGQVRSLREVSRFLLKLRSDEISAERYF